VNNRSADVPRRIDRTHGVTPLGPDAQVDNKALVIPPGNFSLADPFPVGGPFVMNTRARFHRPSTTSIRESLARSRAKHG